MLNFHIHYTFSIFLLPVIQINASEVQQPSLECLAAETDPDYISF
jgi:hypothetical protein